MSATANEQRAADKLRLNMGRFVSHKRVHAAKIVSVSPERVMFAIEGAGEEYAYGFTPPENFFARFMPAPGDYLVVYEDGYISASPRQTFEEGYMPLVDAASYGPHTAPVNFKEWQERVGSALDRARQP